MNRPLSIPVRGTGPLWPAALIFGILLAACLGPVSPAGGFQVPGKGNTGKAVKAYPPSNLRTLQWWLDEVVDTEATTPPDAGYSSPRLAIVTPGIDVRHPDLAPLDIAGARSRGPSEDLVGTAVAGIAAGRGGETGTVGIWPGMKLRHATSGGGSCQEAADAIFGLARKPGRVRVVLLAYSFDGRSCARHLAATQYAVSRGLLVVAPTGNSNPNLPEPRGPAADPHVLGVGAVTESLDLANFSTVGPAVDLFAPGERVLAPYLAGSNGDQVARTHEYLNGTEYGAAMVGAAAAWILEERRQLRASQVRAVLSAGAEDLGSKGRDDLFGFGLLNINNALQETAPTADRYEPNDEIGWVNGRLLSNGRAKIKAKPIWPSRGKKVVKFQATLSGDDPADVYRVRIPRRSRVEIGVDQLEGDVAVEVRKGSSRTIYSRKGRLRFSDRRPGRAAEGLRVRNSTRGFRLVYLVVKPSKRAGSSDARYRVRIGRSLPR